LTKIGNLSVGGLERVSKCNALAAIECGSFYFNLVQELDRPVAGVWLQLTLSWTWACPCLEWSFRGQILRFYSTCRGKTSKADKLAWSNVKLGDWHYLIKRCPKLQNIVDGVATCYGLDYPGFKPQWGRDFPDRSRLYPPMWNGHWASYPGVKWLGLGGDYIPLSSAGVEYE
jgi:hypothetical protein